MKPFVQRLWYTGGMSRPVLLETLHTAVAEGCAEELWDAVVSIGGENGWYCCDALWQLRGLLDRLAGGPGFRRGRRHPAELRPGDPVDFWRVKEVEPPARLLLQAEMRLPGTARLEYLLCPEGARKTRVTLRSTFAPAGVSGRLYWWLAFPLHGPVFDAMLRGLICRAGCSVVNQQL